MSDCAKELEDIARLMEFAEEGLSQAHNLIDFLNSKRGAKALNIKRVQDKASLLKAKLEALEQEYHQLNSSRFHI